MIRRALLPLFIFGSASSALAAPYYQAAPVAQPRQPVVVARDAVWRCAADGCTSERAASRPAIVCAMLVREIGALSSFSANGRAFTAEELESCNARARQG